MSAPKCDYCNELIWHSAVWSPDALPDDIPPNWWGKDVVQYHPSCWEYLIAEARHELALKHGHG